MPQETRHRLGFAVRVGAVALVLLVAGPAARALAAGGAGSAGASGLDTGGAGGTGFTGNPGGNGSDALAGGGGGAGGGAGGTGGVAGGAGGTAGSPNGQPGNGANNTNGAGGGGGGYNGNGAGVATLSNATALTGGNGGAGGAGFSGSGAEAGSGGGGAGGYGAIVTGNGASSSSGTIGGGVGGVGGAGTTPFLGHGLNGGGGGDGGVGVQFTATSATFGNSGTVTGGAGGAGGAAGVTGFGSGTPGAAGAGGAGIVGSGLTIMNSGTIAGGAGGAGGTAGFSNGVAFLGTSGAGGAGIAASGLTLTNSGTISGGLSGDGLTRATAISLSGAAASLITLQTGAVVNGDIAGSAAVGATNALVLQGSGSYVGNVTSFTTLNLQPSGAWSVTLPGASSIVTTTIASGSLTVGDAAHPGATLVGDVMVTGGTLGGFGTITGTVTNSGGMVSPGSGGALRVIGNYVQGTGGILAIQVAPSAAAKLAATGTAALAGALAVTAQPGNYVVGTKYAIVTAGSGITGTFGQTSGLTSPAASFTLSYASNEVDLTVLSNGNPGLGSLIGLASAGLSSGHAIVSVLGEQIFATHGAGATALAQGPGVARVQLASLDPVATLAQGPAPQPFGAASPWSAWLSGFGVFGDVGGNATTGRLNYTTGGTTLGIDDRLDPSFLAGAFFSYANTGSSVSGVAGNGTINSYAVGIYGSRTFERLYVDAMLGYAYQDDTLQRTIAGSGISTSTARAGTQGNLFLSSIETGRSYDLPERVVATPFIGLQASAIDQASFTETGAGAFNLAVGGQSQSSVRSQLGTRLARDVELAGLVTTVGVKLGWAHEFSDTGSTTTASFAGAPGANFTVQGAQRGRDSALVGVGIATKLDPQSSVYLRYDGDLNGTDNAHAVIGGVRLTW